MKKALALVTATVILASSVTVFASGGLNTVPEPGASQQLGVSQASDTTILVRGQIFDPANGGLQPQISITMPVAANWAVVPDTGTPAGPPLGFWDDGDVASAVHIISTNSSNAISVSLVSFANILPEAISGRPDYSIAAIDNDLVLRLARPFVDATGVRLPVNEDFAVGTVMLVNNGAFPNLAPATPILLADNLTATASFRYVFEGEFTSDFEDLLGPGTRGNDTFHDMRFLFELN